MKPTRRGFLASSLAAPLLATSSPPAPAAPATAPTRIGVAFGSGSQHGLAHVGVIKALSERGLQPAIVTGCSVGAIAGALWASGLGWERIREAADKVAWTAGQRLSLGLGLLRNEAVRRLVDEETAGRPIEDWPIRFGAVAADFATGERVLLSSGAAGAAVMASSSMPVLYAPVQIGGRALVDGALVEPVPVRAARELGADLVIAIDVAFRPAEEPARSLLGTPFQAMHILVNRLIDEQIGEADLAIRLNVHHLFSEPDTERRLVAAGEQAVRAHWPRVEALATRVRPARDARGCTT